MVVIKLKVTEVGDSLYLLLDRASKEKLSKSMSLNILKDDIVALDLLGLENDYDNTKSYKCLVCLHHFDQDEEKPYCPACGVEGSAIVEVDE